MDEALSRPGVGVGVIIRSGDRVLLLRRKGAHGSGSWSPPGGHLEYGESPEACALRETREETSLGVQHPKLVALTNDVFAAERKHYITLWVEAEYEGGEPVVSAPEESDRVGWFSWDELPDPLFLPLRNLLGGNCYPPEFKPVR